MRFTRPPYSRKALPLAGWALLCLVTAAVLVGTQRQGEEDLKRRFGDRTEVAARFAATYARDLLEQERRVAMRELSGVRVSSEDLDRVTSLFGNEAAVLLDADGRALHLAPTKTSLIGRDLAKRYPHLREAAAGRPAVSNVVPSAVKGIPVVAFATPFDSKGGRRVFSGAFDVQETPIGAYLRNSAPFTGAHVYLLDTSGAIVASNRDLVGVKTITLADPQLARGLARSASDETSDGYQYASEPVAGTPWRLVMSAPTAQLLQPLHGFRRFVPWVLWAGFALGGLACTLLVANLITSRRKLRDANGDLAHLARVDALTGIDNRRQAQASLEAAIATARRHKRPLSVLMIDVDRFKAINDNHGHDVGDGVLRLVADHVRGSLRADDLVGRWGGEEFLALLPSTDHNGAAVVAERVRDAVSSAAVVVGGRLVPVSVSIGAATLRLDQADALVAEADAAMYAAKAAGRDRVRIAR